MTDAARRRGAAGLAPAAAVLALAAIALWLAADAGVAGPRAVPDLARGLLASLVLFGVPGIALARRLLPASAASLWPLFALPLGAAAACLAMTLLGFARVPIEVSLAAILLAGAVAGVGPGRRRAAPATGGPPRWWPLAVACVAALAVSLALVPSLRSGFATVPGENPDAHLVTGSAVLLQEAPPDAKRVELPVDEVPDVWRSKHPILYALAGVSELSGLDPIEAFPAVGALLVGLAVAGFALLALLVLRAAPPVALAVGCVLALDAAMLHVALHPYWNQMWGLAMLPFAFVLGWLAVEARDRGAAALFGLVLAMGVFAYPLMLPYPVIAVAGFALARGMRPRLPDWPRRRLALAGAVAVALLAVPLYGVVEKIGSAARQFADPSPDLSAWTGDVVEFFPVDTFVSLRGGVVAICVVCALAAVALWRFVPRDVALPLAALLALCALATLRFRTIEFGAYFDFKHLSFVAPLLLTLATVACCGLVLRARPAALAAGASLLVAYAVFATIETRDELARTYDQVTRPMLELREWSERLPEGASVRLDIPPTGVQLWAGYMLAEHPLTAPIPVVGTTYPHAPQGLRADYSLTVFRGPAPGTRGPELPLRRAPDTTDPPLFRNGQFALRRLRPAPPEYPETASREMVEGIPSSQPPAP